MGLTLKINTILRTNRSDMLEVGSEYEFEKDGLYLLADDIHIWLASKDWTALAEIMVTSQTRTKGKTTGTYTVKHVYVGAEKNVLTEIFKRMYGQL